MSDFAFFPVTTSRDGEQLHDLPTSSRDPLTGKHIDYIILINSKAVARKSR